MLRTDLAKSIELVPPEIRQDLDGNAAASLEFLNENLPPNEEVTAVTSVKASKEAPSSACVLAITDSRLVFVSSSPQAVAWRLSLLTRMQIFSGYFFIEGDAGNYSLGMQDNAWSTEFAARLKRANAAAVIAAR